MLRQKKKRGGWGFKDKPLVSKLNFLCVQIHIFCFKLPSPMKSLPLLYNHDLRGKSIFMDLDVAFYLYANMTLSHYFPRTVTDIITSIIWPQIISITCSWYDIWRLSRSISSQSEFNCRIGLIAKWGQISKECVSLHSDRPFALKYALFFFWPQTKWKMGNNASN